MKPILFSTPMVLATCDDSKTNTRRVITGLPEGVYRIDSDDGKIWGAYYGRYQDNVHFTCCQDIKPKYLPGDILWVRETWMPETEQGIHTGGYIYKATDHPEPDGDEKLKWRPSIFMPKDAARIFLRITGVRPEILQDISELDARLEGISYWDDVGCCCSNRKFMDYSTGEFSIKEDPRKSFQTLWDSINAARGFGWDKNPWVWVYTFDRITRDEAMEAST